ALAVTTDGTHQFTAGMDYSIFSYYPSWRVEKRLLSDGSLVSGFGVGGAVKTPVPATFGWLAARPSCMVLVGSVVFIGGFGQINLAGDVGWRLECRSVTDGSLVSGFG